MNICIFLLESDFKEDGFDTDVLMTMSDTEVTLYVLDLKSIRKVQLNNESLMVMV